jgi:hypothetical protein
VVGRECIVTAWRPVIALGHYLVSRPVGGLLSPLLLLWINLVVSTRMRGATLASALVFFLVELAWVRWRQVDPSTTSSTGVRVV